MTKKFAVFVEGQTEQEFTIKLLTELAGRHGIEFEVHIQHQGKLFFSELRSHQSPIIHDLPVNCYLISLNLSLLNLPNVSCHPRKNYQPVQ